MNNKNVIIFGVLCLAALSAAAYLILRKKPAKVFNKNNTTSPNIVSPNIVSPNTSIVAKINPSQVVDNRDVAIYLADGKKIYKEPESIYIAPYIPINISPYKQLFPHKGYDGFVHTADAGVIYNERAPTGKTDLYGELYIPRLREYGTGGYNNREELF